jgi:ribosome-binding protein aMBF1 (putative translation factor)
MPRSYKDVTASRRERLPADAGAHRERVERAYDLSVRLVELRERLGLTQAELAARCDVDPGDIGRIERGASLPTDRELRRIAESLGVDVRHFDA